MANKTLEEEFDDVSMLDDDAEANVARLLKKLFGEQDSYVNDDDTPTTRSRASWDFFESTQEILKYVARREGYTNIGRFIEVRILFPYLRYYQNKKSIKIRNLEKLEKE